MKSVSGRRTNPQEKKILKIMNMRGVGTMLRGLSTVKSPLDSTGNKKHEY